MATLPTFAPRRTPTYARGIDAGVSPLEMGATARATQELGSTMLGIGTDMADRIQKEQDASAIFAARRQLDDWERTSIYDPQNGAISKKGIDAFDLPNKLPQEFDKFTGQLGESLKSPRQKQAFQELVTSRRAQIGDFAARHATQQRQVYNEGQFNADIDSSLNRSAMLVDSGDMNTAKAEIGLAQTRTTGYLRSLGKSEEEIGVAVRNVSSKANVTAINMLLEKDKPMEADAYLKANANSMNVEDLLRAQAAVGKQVDARVGLVTATEIVSNSVLPAVNPTDSMRLANLAGAVDLSRLNLAKRNAESGNRDLNPDGSVVTSPKGAKGRDQVMDATNRDPGYGVKPAQNDSLEERSRVGTDYLAAMVKEYRGDIPKALAAYNAGPGAVNKAMEQAAKSRGGQDAWLGYLPDETKAYVAKVTKEYNAGAGAPQLPTLQALHQQVREKVGFSNPQRYQTAIQEVNRQYDDLLKAKKQTEEKYTTDAYDWLANNNGDFARMPAGLRANLPAQKLDDVMTFAGKMAAGVPVQTDWDTYTQLRAMATSNPAKFASTDLRAYYPTIAPAQREQLIDLQTKANDPKTQPEVIALSKHLGIAHGQLGIDKNAQKKGMFDNAVAEEIAAEQREKKRELTYEERDKIIKRLQLPTEGTGWFGWGGSNMYAVAGTSKAADAKPKIDDEARKLITQALQAEGQQVTDAAIQQRFNLRYGIK
jgi:hypothetical protein